MWRQALHAVLCWLTFSETFGEANKNVISSIVDNDSAESASRLYRSVPAGVYASNSPYAAYSFQIPSFISAPNAASRIVPVKQQIQDIHQNNGYLRDSYGNRFNTPQIASYRTTFPQQYVALQALPAHLAQPLVAAPQNKQTAPHYFAGSQYRVPTFQITANNPGSGFRGFSQYSYPQDLRSFVSSSNQQPQVNKVIANQEQPVSNKGFYTSVAPAAEQVKGLSTESKFQRYEYRPEETYRNEQRGSVTGHPSEDKGQIEAAAAKTPVTAIVNGKKTVINIETKPVIPLLDLSLLQPLTFDNPLVPQLQHFLPKIPDAKYHTLNEFQEATKKQKKPKAATKKKPKQQSHQNKLPVKPVVTVTGNAKESPEIVYEINTPNHRETYKEKSISYNKKVEAEPETYSYNQKTEAEPVHYSYSNTEQKEPVSYNVVYSSNKPQQITQVSHRGEEEQPRQLIYTFNADEAVSPNNHGESEAPGSTEDSGSVEVNDENEPVPHNQHANDEILHEPKINYQRHNGDYHSNHHPKTYHNEDNHHNDHRHNSNNHNEPHHNAPHHNTPRHNAPHHSAPHHNAPHHSAPHHNAPHHSAPHHNAPHHSAPHHNAPHHNGPHHNAPHHNAPQHDAPHHDAPHHDAPHHDTPHHDDRHHNGRHHNDYHQSDHHQNDRHNNEQYRNDHHNHPRNDRPEHREKDYSAEDEDSTPHKKYRSQDAGHHQEKNREYHHPDEAHHHRPAKNHQYSQNQEHHQKQEKRTKPNQGYPSQQYHHSPKQELNRQRPNQEHHHRPNERDHHETQQHPETSSEILSHPHEHEEDIRLLPPHNAPIKVDPNQHVQQPESHPSPQPSAIPEHDEQAQPLYDHGTPIIQEQGKRIIIKEESPEELHMHQEQITAEIIDQENTNEEDFEKAYKNAAYGFPAFEKKVEIPTSYGYSGDENFSGERNPFQQYQAEGDSFPGTSRLNYNKALEDTEKGYLLDYSVHKPESVADRHRNKANYYKLYEKYKPAKYFSIENDKKKEKQQERYTAAPTFDFGRPAKPKSNGYFAQYKAEPIKYEFDYSKGTPRDNSAHASHPYQRLKSKTLFVEPQFQYGFDPIALPRLLDSELATMASNHSPESEKPGMRKKIYEENWYIKKTSTAGGKPS